MTAGLASGSANTWLNNLDTEWAYTQLHTGDPGANGTANVSSVTTREAQSWSAAASGSKSESGTPSWSSWAGTNGEIVTHISGWTLASGGVFAGSVALSASKTLNTGDTLNLDTLTAALSPLAA